MRLVRVYESKRYRSLPTTDGAGFEVTHALAGGVNANLPCRLESPAASDWPEWTWIGMNTVFVGRLRLVLVPPLSVALSRTLIVCPRSVSVGLYSDAVAPAISVQFVPAASQRSHWRWTLGVSTHTSV